MNQNYNHDIDTYNDILVHKLKKRSLNRIKRFANIVLMSNNITSIEALSDYTNIRYITFYKVDLRNINLQGKYPPNLVKMILDQCVNPITNFPNTVKCLVIDHCKFNTPVFNFSDNLIHLLLNNCDYQFPLDNLPHSLITFQYNCWINEYKYTFDHLPQGLQMLHIIGYYDNPIDNLPNTLREFMIRIFKARTKPEHSINLDMLPDSIEILKIESDFCRITKLPANLKELQINRNHPDYNVLKENFPNIKDKFC